ncbi:Probable low-specificity L-threonine aldolase 1 [Geodia barretti]|uniref:Probable low-specificity L-threonine aldolase 1 n=1 Tax=Geodia barretti TaxID=519541 RepID=A0AA35W8G8_GEOBA|nr:Probable low-specificity L-threonine aldolase 1 [Geodia barretti]
MEVSNGEEGMSMVVMGRYGVLYTKPRPKSAETSPRVIDMRSDTVTRPTEEMRVAMFEAEVGDDVFGEDPTVAELEKKAAELLGKEAGLFVASGTMGNLAAMMSHCWSRGEEVLAGDQSHVVLFEQGGAAQIGNFFLRTVRNLPDGTLDLEELRSKLQPEGKVAGDPHKTMTRLIVVENTHNMMGGRVIRPEYMDRLAELIRGLGIRIHVDGARLFNAATALGLPPAELVKHADSVTICLSKGLSAPAGSVLVGTAHFISRARRVRKSLGGGMRQVGVLAAPGIIALEKMSQRLEIDHNMAKFLGRGLVSMSDLGVDLDLEAVETNIVFFGLQRSDMTAEDFVARLEKEGVANGDRVIVKMLPARVASGEVKVRAVLNHHVTHQGVECALIRIREILANRGGRKRKQET